MKPSTTSTAQTADSKSLSNIRFITITALFIALTYVFTAFINIRLPITANGGLIHLGNVPLFICAIIFGKKSGAIAGGVGMGLFDLLSGWRRLRLQGKHLQHRRRRPVHRGRFLRRLYCQRLESPRSTRMDRSTAGQHDRRRPVGPAPRPAARLSPREYRHCDDHDELHRHVSCELSHQDRPDL